MFDLLIRGARIIDGTGAPAWTGDLAVSDGKIAAVFHWLDKILWHLSQNSGEICASGRSADTGRSDP